LFVSFSVERLSKRLRSFTVPVLHRHVLTLVFASLSATACIAMSNDAAAGPTSSVPAAQIFAPGVVSGPANDGSPAFSPDGNTIFFTRSTANWGVIVESHNVDGHWTQPTLAVFSGEWPDSSPSMSPDGSYLVFESNRPAAPLTSRPKEGEAIPGIVSNLWRVDRVGTGWSKPKRLPDTVNLAGQSIWKPSIAADGTIYFVAIDRKGGKRLFSSQYKDGAYQQAQPLPFSDGATLDVDPEIAPDGSFLVFCSAGRLPGDSKDHLFIVLRKAEGWGTVVPIRYAGDDKNGYSTDDEPHLGPDHRTLYFSSDRVVPAHFPRSPEEAQSDFKHLDSLGWFSGYANVWFIPISAWLNGDDAGKSSATK
jgi:WD40-like Beta Propeller Repeat